MSEDTKKHGNRLSWIVVLAIVAGVLSSVLLFGLFVYSALSILGPLDHPHFEDKEWASLHVRYYIVHSKDRLEHRDIVLAGGELSALKKVFVTKSSSGKSIPNPAHFWLVLKSGKQWGISMAGVNELSFCYREDNYYAYSVELTDTRFFEKLREYCWQDAVKTIPECKIENISITTHVSIKKGRDEMNANGIEVGVGGKLSQGRLFEQCLPLSLEKTDSEEE
jgi:hypothetical protein